jgi:hypothetical protein
VSSPNSYVRILTRLDMLTLKYRYTMGRPFCTKAIETKTDKHLINFVRHISSLIEVKTE